MARNHEPGMPNAKKQTSGSGRWTNYEPVRGTSSISWDEVSTTGIVKLVQVTTRAGDAILFGCTSDGGTLAITLCSGERRIKFYGRTVEELESRMHEILGMYDQ